MVKKLVIPLALAISLSGCGMPNASVNTKANGNTALYDSAMAQPVVNNYTNGGYGDILARAIHLQEQQGKMQEQQSKLQVDFSKEQAKNKEYIAKNGEMWASAMVEKLALNDKVYKKAQVKLAFFYCEKNFEQSKEVCVPLIENKEKIFKFAHLTEREYKNYVRGRK